MTATTAQLEALAAVDPIAAADAVAVSVDYWFTSAAAVLNTTRVADAVLAQALYVAHQLRLTNPNVGGGPLVGVGEAVGGSRAKSTMNLPPGYPADWYTTSPGVRLIGLMSGSTTLPIATG